MINRLLLNEHAYFYKRFAKGLPKTKIEQILRKASSKKKGNYICNEVKLSRKVKGQDVLYSLCVFEYETDPTFLIGGSEIELKYGYLLLVEFEDFVFVSKKGVSDFGNIFYKYAVELDNHILSKLFVDKKTLFPKISYINTELGPNAVRSNSMEGNDLKNSLSVIQTSNKILKNLRLQNGEQSTTISLSTSRINQYGDKILIDDFILWCISKTEQYRNFKEKESFIDNFAQTLDFKSNISLLTPKTLFILTSDLMNDIESNNIILAEYHFGSSHKPRKIDILKYLQTNEWIFTLKQKDKEHYIVSNKAFDKTLSILILKEKISLYSEKISKIELHFADGSSSSLLEYYNRKNSFIVTFDKPGLRYISKSLYRDNRLLTNINFFLKCFIPVKKLNITKGEKGNGYTAASTSFTNDSIFSIVENDIDLKSDFLFCDDFGDEWADYISYKKNEYIIFYHAKFGAQSLSASKFEIVVSQALKNIGNFDFMNSVNRKTRSWEEYYTTTKIARLRRGIGIRQAKSVLEATLSNPQTRRENCLVVNFLSLKSLKDELIKLKNEQPVGHQITQLLWLLSSFISGCMEKNIVPKIYCSP